MKILAKKSWAGPKIFANALAITTCVKLKAHY